MKEGEAGLFREPFVAVNVSEGRPDRDYTWSGSTSPRWYISRQSYPVQSRRFYSETGRDYVLLS